MIYVLMKRIIPFSTLYVTLFKIFPQNLSTALSKKTLSRTIRCHKTLSHRKKLRNHNIHFWVLVWFINLSMTSCLKLEVQTEDQVPHKWFISLAEDEFKRLLSQGNPTVHKVFGEGSLFSPLLFGKFFDPSDAFPLWDFESDCLLANLRSSGKNSVDWFQTDQAYVLKAELPGVGKTNNVQIHIEKGKIVDIFGQLKLLQRESQTKDWRSCNWWEYGYVRRLELPEDADCRRIEAYLSNDVVLEIRIPRNPLLTDTSGTGVGKNSA